MGRLPHAHLADTLSLATSNPSFFLFLFSSFSCVDRSCLDVQRCTFRQRLAISLYKDGSTPDTFIIHSQSKTHKPRINTLADP
jgi:hypothetical protein